MSAASPGNSASPAGPDDHAPAELSPAELAALSPLERVFRSWQKIPLYLRILLGVVLGVILGLALYQEPPPAPVKPPAREAVAQPAKPPLTWRGKAIIAVETPAKLVLRVLGALAPPLVFLAVIQALVHARLPRGSASRLVGLLVLNTLVAIFIGLLVANLIQPGRWSGEVQIHEEAVKKERPDPVQAFLDNAPKSLLGPFGDDGKVLSVILLSVVFGIALRRLYALQAPGSVAAMELIGLGFRLIVTLLHWVIEVLPLAVLGVVAGILGRGGVGAFRSLSAFCVAVILALLLQLGYYLVRIRFGSWVKPWDVLVGMRDALVMAFSTGSSTATMPVTYACLREKVGLREQSASLGALVGANFNNDGTALYEAMSALFVSQLIGQQLSLWQQVLVVITSVFASVGAAGIPEAGLVTMTLVFTAVGLPTHYIFALLPVDWFLDRCRTAVNVMGDVNVSCLLDGYEREIHPASPEDAELKEMLDDPPAPPPESPDA